MQEDTDPRLEFRPVQAGSSIVLICLSGKLDTDTAAPLRETIMQVASRHHERRRLLLDLSALTHCDTTGLLTLLGIYQALEAIGITVSIPWTGPIADAAIESAGLQNRLPLETHPSHPDTSDIPTSPPLGHSPVITRACCKGQPRGGRPGPGARPRP